MTEDLLRDLSQYKKARDKPVATAARALIALFRELAPSLLEKKDRGKGADLEKSVKAYGTKVVSERVDGAELLQLERIKRKRLVAEIETMTEFEEEEMMMMMVTSIVIVIVIAIVIATMRKKMKRIPRKSRISNSPKTSWKKTTFFL